MVKAQRASSVECLTLNEDSYITPQSRHREHHMRGGAREMGRAGGWGGLQENSVFWT